MSVLQVIVLHPYTKSEVRRLSHSEDMVDFFGHGVQFHYLSVW